MSDVTRIPDRVQQGEAKAAEELLPLVYDELRRLAAARMAHEGSTQRLQPAAVAQQGVLNCHKHFRPKRRLPFP
ncbi:MAG: ECF-type sigma factor [Limisphaerales bacterium]